MYRLWAVQDLGAEVSDEALVDKVPVSVHERNLRNLRCVVSAQHPVTLHHCHGGSMLTMIGGSGNTRGTSQKTNPFYQIPIIMKYHTGEYGIDTGLGVDQWEENFGEQLAFLEEVNGLLSYNIFFQAGIWWAAERGW